MRVVKTIDSSSYRRPDHLGHGARASEVTVAGNFRQGFGKKRETRRAKARSRSPRSWLHGLSAHDKPRPMVAAGGCPDSGRWHHRMADSPTHHCADKSRHTCLTSSGHLASRLLAKVDGKQLGVLGTSITVSVVYYRTDIAEMHVGWNKARRLE